MLLVEVEVKPSPLHGLGIFARSAIPKGTMTWTFHPAVDSVLSDEELAAMPPAFQSLMDVHGYRDLRTGNWMLNADMAKFTNHSHQPNVKEDPETGNCYAIVDIAAGEEILENYLDFASGGCTEFIEPRTAAA